MDEQTVNSVELMRSIRELLFENFQKDIKAEESALKKIRSKYQIAENQPKMRVATPPPEYSKITPESDR
jgi:hypothetical protein